MELSRTGKRNSGLDTLASLAGICGAPDYHRVLQGSHDNPDFAVMRIRSGPRLVEKAPAYPVADAFLVCVSLNPTAVDQWRARYQGRDVGVTQAIAFATTVLDLRCSMDVSIRGPFDYFLYYLSAPFLRRVAAENEIAAARKLCAAFFVEDLVIAQLTRSILSAARHGEPLEGKALEQLALVLGAHVLQRYCGITQVATVAHRGLQTWQKLRVEELLRAQLDGNISTRQLASACSISVRHFARGFRRSFGTSVHQHRVRLRIERARSLLATTRKPLAEIAHLCGFCDQAAFSRAFGRLEHVTPLRWRKLNTSS